MKKLVSALAILFTLTLITSCQNAAIANGTTGEIRVGNGGNSVLWSSFDGTDLQIWDGTFTAETDNTNGLIITVGSVGWWGGSFCNNGATAANAVDVVTFNMSNVAKITFDAKASATGSMWVSNSNSSATGQGLTAITLTTEWATKTFNCSGSVSANDYAVMAIGGGELSTTTTSGYKVYIKNIAFWNSSGVEITPSRNN